MNIGFAFWIMTIAETVSNNRELMEILSAKVGGFLIYLGIMLFFNLYLFFRGRKKSKAFRQQLAPGI